MNNRLGCDTFVFEKTMAEDLSSNLEEQGFSEDTINSGILFRPNTNLLFSEFLTQGNEGKKYCITQIDSFGNHHSYSDLTFEQAESIIEEKKMDLSHNDEAYLTIFNMADGITFEEYKNECMKEYEKVFLGYTYWREGYTISSENFLKDINEILGKHKGSFKMYNVFTDKTSCFYQGVVFIDTAIDGVTEEQAQQYFERQLLEIEKELGCS